MVSRCQACQARPDIFFSTCALYYGLTAIVFRISNGRLGKPVRTAEQARDGNSNFKIFMNSINQRGPESSHDISAIEPCSLDDFLIMHSYN